MPRISYSPEVKDKILSAVALARASNRPWDETLMAAKEAGYQGALPGLQKLMRDAAIKAGGHVEKRKPGRPRKNPASASHRLMAAGTGTVQEALQSAIGTLVKERVRMALAKIRVALDEAEGG